MPRYKKVFRMQNSNLTGTENLPTVKDLTMEDMVVRKQHRRALKNVIVLSCKPSERP